MSTQTTDDEPTVVLTLGQGLFAGAAEPVPAQETEPEPADAAATDSPAQQHLVDVFGRLLAGQVAFDSLKAHPAPVHPKPYIEGHLMHDVGLQRLKACQELYGGEITSSDYSGAYGGPQVYSQLTVNVDDVPVTFWTILPAAPQAVAS